MSREIYQKYGLIIILAIAGITIPTSIITLTREPTEVNNNYYNIYNYGNNETEPDYSKPLEKIEHCYFNRYECFVRNFTLDSKYAYWVYYNKSSTFSLSFWVIRSIFYESVVSFNGTSQLNWFLAYGSTYANSFASDLDSFIYTPPFISEWLFIYMSDDIGAYNITLMDEILKI